MAENNMKQYVGIWLDRREAFVVSILRDQPVSGNDQDAIERIESQIQRRVWFSGGSRGRKTLFGPQEISVDSKQEECIKGQLCKYYQ